MSSSARPSLRFFNRLRKWAALRPLLVVEINTREI
jgi:hypothetical protein